MLTLYFNRSFSATSFLIRSLRQRWRGEELQIIISHGREDPHLREVADHFELEPKAKGESYFDYVFEVCKRHKVDVFFPRKHVTYLASHRDRFDRIGVKVAFVGEHHIYELFDHKLRASEALGGQNILEIPETSLVSDYKTFHQEYERIRESPLVPDSSSLETVCLKPNIGIGGKGFMRIAHQRTAFEDLFRESIHSISFTRLDQALRDADPFPELLLATYLNGLEVSVDCIGNKGQLLAAYPRIYVNKYEQRFDDYPELTDICRAICQTYKLSYLFNVQFKQHHGRWFFIELNTRSAAGAHRLCSLKVCPLSAALNLCLDQSIDQPLDIEWGSVVRRVETYEGCTVFPQDYQISGPEA